MTLIYVEPIDEESAWHMPICRVVNLEGSFVVISMNVVDISKIKYITRGGLKKNKTNDNRSK